MQRFYQAVELDEAEMARKRSQSVEPNSGKKLKSLEQTLQRNECSSLNALDKKVVNLRTFEFPVDFIYEILSKTPFCMVQHIVCILNIMQIAGIFLSILSIAF